MGWGKSLGPKNQRQDQEAEVTLKNYKQTKRKDGVYDG